MQRVKTSAFRWTMDAAGDWLCIQTNKARQVLDSLKPGKVYDVEIKEHREKRSLDANRYCWVLLGKLADKLFPVTKNEIYREYVRQIGPYKDFELTEGEAKTFRVVWENRARAGRRNRWILRQMGNGLLSGRITVAAPTIPNRCPG